MKFSAVPSEAVDLVLDATHPSPEAGGPCTTCAFRIGTDANRTEHTMVLARLCVEGVTPFYCHEKPQLCRGYIAAVNVRGKPETKDDKRWCAVARMAAEMLGACITVAREFQDASEAVASERTQESTP